MDAEAACIICNWARDGVPLPFWGLAVVATVVGGLFGGGFFGSGGGDSDDASGDETVPPYHHTDPWDEGHRRWYEERQREESEAYEREREADRQERWERRRQEFNDRPWSEHTLLDVTESVQIWAQELFGLDPDNPEGKGTVPGASKA